MLQSNHDCYLAVLYDARYTRHSRPVGLHSCYLHIILFGLLVLTYCKGYIYLTCTLLAIEFSLLVAT